MYNIIMKDLTASVYYAMRTRCYCKTVNKWKCYGGKGITVCKRWMAHDGLGLQHFKEDIGERPSIEFTLDRIDSNGNYEPSNCRWISFNDNRRNRKKFSMHKINGPFISCSCKYCKEKRLDK